MEISLADANILITGASAGIGRACAIECSRSGARVHLVGRNQAELRKTQAALAGEGHSSNLFDLHDFDGYQGLVDQVVSQHGKLSGFVHAAGIQYMLPFQSTKVAAYQDSFDINTIAAFELARIVVQKKNNLGANLKLVFLASVMSLVGDIAISSYCASKTALVGGARCMAVELASKGIQVNCVSPGSIEDTELANLRTLLSEDDFAAHKARYPLGLGKTQDVAALCVYLLSDKANWITGQNFVIDGGYSAK